MLLGEFRKKTENLDDGVELMIFIAEKSDQNVVLRDEVIVPVNTLDYDADVDGENILSITDGKAGSYSL